MDSWRSQVVAEALTWRNTPFQHQQRLKGVGADCAQWISAVYEEILGWPRQDFGEYPEFWMKHGHDDLYMNQVRRLFVECTNSALPGDLIVFKYGKFFSHGAILVSWPIVIHADARGSRKVTEADITKGPLGRQQMCFWTPII
jgi:cell wall-associated NlpC family hydrolase